MIPSSIDLHSAVFFYWYFKHPFVYLSNSTLICLLFLFSCFFFFLLPPHFSPTSLSLKLNQVFPTEANPKSVYLYSYNPTSFLIILNQLNAQLLSSNISQCPTTWLTILNQLNAHPQIPPTNGKKIKQLQIENRKFKQALNYNNCFKILDGPILHPCENLQIHWSTHTRSN